MKTKNIPSKPKKASPKKDFPAKKNHPKGNSSHWINRIIQNKKPSSSSRSNKKEKAPQKINKSQSSHLSFNRKLDILGIFLTLGGFLLILSMVSLTQGWLTNQFTVFLSQYLGWGKILLPIAIIFLGVWLIIRNFENIPTLSVERSVGIILLFLNLLADFHYFALILFTNPPEQWILQGAGGGKIGAFLFSILNNSFGLIGSVIALLAWLVISFMMTFDMQIATMVQLIKQLTQTIQNFFKKLTNQGQPQLANPIPSTTPLSQPFNTLPGLQSKPRSSHQPRSSTTNPPPSISPATPGSSQVWQLPDPQTILEVGDQVLINSDTDQHRARIIEETLQSFGAPAHIVEIHRGPVITQFGVEPDYTETRSGRTRVRVGKIASLADDLALALSARTVRIQAPVPGKGYVGIEVPNEQPAMVTLRDVIESDVFQKVHTPLRFALGQDVAGNAVVVDLAAMPHLLIAGTTGSGKSVCVNSLISCLLIHNTPNQLRLIMVDPKRVELSNYNGIPHLLAPVVVDLKRVVGVLQWITREMDTRYHKLAQAGTRNIVEYNAHLKENGEQPLPFLVVIIDELADLMMLAPEETERNLTRLAQLARATGIHLVIATQRPSVDVVTGLIKANFPARVAFAVASGVDSRVILDQPGAERLLGRGDMLYQAPDAPAPIRLQGTYVSDLEIQHLVDYWQNQSLQNPSVSSATIDSSPLSPSSIPLKQIPLWEEMDPVEQQDPLLPEAIDLSRRQGRSSISMLQRRLRIGYTRAARLVDIMEEKGIVGPPLPGTGTREILDYGDAAPPAGEGE